MSVLKTSLVLSQLFGGMHRSLQGEKPSPLGCVVPFLPQAAGSSSSSAQLLHLSPPPGPHLISDHQSETQQTPLSSLSPALQGPCLSRPAQETTPLTKNTYSSATPPVLHSSLSWGGRDPRG